MDAAVKNSQVWSVAVRNKTVRVDDTQDIDITRRWEADERLVLKEERRERFLPLDDAGLLVERCCGRNTEEGSGGREEDELHICRVREKFRLMDKGVVSSCGERRVSSVGLGSGWHVLRKL